MAPITDLLFEQLAAQTEVNSDVFFVGEDTTGEIGVLISLTALLGEPVEALSATGVVKAVTRLLELCRKAQQVVNAGQAPGEKLDAFPTSASTGTLIDGVIEVVDTVKSKILLNSATRVEGHTDAAASTTASGPLD